MRYLITGGSASGKSTFAEALALRCPAPRTYLATMRPMGREDQRRIDRHRRMREDKGFVTLERYADIGGAALPVGGTVLLECLCNLTANEMFDAPRASRGADNACADLPAFCPANVDPYAAKAVLQGVYRLLTKCDTLIIVTNDVGGDGGGYEALTMAYVDTLGYINAALARTCERVYELVCGIPLPLKGALP